MKNSVLLSSLSIVGVTALAQHPRTEAGAIAIELKTLGQH